MKNHATRGGRLNPLALMLLALAIVIAFVTKASAASPVCTLDGMPYESVADAVAAIPDGGSGTIVLTADSEVTKTIAVPADKSVTLTDDGTARVLTSAVPMFDVDGDLAISATSDTDLTLEFTAANSTSGTGNIVRLGNAGGSAHLSLTAGTIKGGNVNAPNGAIMILGNSVFDMSGGVITGCTCGVNFNGPVYIKGAGVMNLSGGSITGNVSASSCGVALIEMDRSKSPTLNMSGGSITGNDGGYGTAVYCALNSVFNLSGGTISHNTSSESGSGIVAMTGVSTMNMTGGVVEENESDYATIQVASTSTCTFSAGVIRNNVAEVAGGAIFATRATTSLVFNDTVIYGNHATIMGGGVWFCPTGAGEIGDEMAIYDNSADGAGDDFASLFTDEGDKNGDIDLGSHALGLGSVNYYTDGAVLPRAGSDAKEAWKGVVDASVPRFDAGNPGDPVEVSGPVTANISLKAIMSDAGKDRAFEGASLFIYGNTAAYGGAIACNGLLSAGQVDDLDDPHEVLLSKVDGAGASLAGATLQIVDEFGDVVDEWVTALDVTHATSLEPGLYTLVEAAAPKGYLTAAPIDFEVGLDGSVTVSGAQVGQVVMVDEAAPDDPPTPDDPQSPEPPKSTGPAVPATGDVGSAASLLAAIGGAALLAIRRRMR